MIGHTDSISLDQGLTAHVGITVGEEHTFVASGFFVLADATWLDDLVI